MPLFADHGIGVPIPDAAAQVDYFRAFFDGYSILDLATPLDTALALAPLLLTSQVGVTVATVDFISIDMLVDPLGANAWHIIIFQVATDLLRAPVFADPLFNPSPHSIRNAGAQNL